MKIQKRSVNVKRHTNGYLVGGKWRSRQETVALARDGKIDGVRTVVRSDGIRYIQSQTQHVNLYDLPIVVRG